MSKIPDSSGTVFSSFATSALGLAILTGFSYTIGLAYVSSLYSRFGVSNSVLEFTVEDYVIHAYRPVPRIYLAHNVWITVALVLLVILIRKFSSYKNPLCLIIGGILFLWPEPSISYVSVRLFGLALISYTALKTDLLRQNRRAVVAVSGVVVWFSLLHASAKAGTLQACRIVEDPSLTSLIGIATDRPLIESLESDDGSRKLVIVEEGEHDRWRIAGLRLLAKTQSGLLVYPSGEDPTDKVQILPIQENDVITIAKDSPAPRDTGSKTCEQLKAI